MSKKILSALWEFSRPHTIVGTILSVTALYVMAAGSEKVILSNFAQWSGAAIACICINIYIVGLNQLLDIEIDKINKPNLPLAAKKLTPRQGWLIIGFCLILGLALAWKLGNFLFLTIITSAFIGTIYSAPPIRLKRFSFWAAICIFSVRGIIVNLGLFLHFNQVLNQHLGIPPQIFLLTIFILIFTFVIAIFKDMPDIEGDRQFNIATLSINWGKTSVFNLSLRVLLGLYIFIILISFTALISGLNNSLMIGSHATLGIVLWRRSINIDLNNYQEITDFYQFIWKLFYLEYIIFPLSSVI